MIPVRKRVLKTVTVPSKIVNVNKAFGPAKLTKDELKHFLKMVNYKQSITNPNNFMRESKEVGTFYLRISEPEPGKYNLKVAHQIPNDPRIEAKSQEEVDWLFWKLKDFADQKARKAGGK